MKRTFLSIALLLLLLVATVTFFQKGIGKSTRVQISDTGDKLRISAEFPGSKSGFVHDYLKTKLNLSDLTDLNYLEIKHYDTPDRLMRFYIKSRADYVKISLNKNENTRDAYHKLKEAGEDLAKALRTNDQLKN